MAGTAKRQKNTKRATWIKNLPTNGRGVAWGYFSRSGKTLEIYVQANEGIEPVKVNLTLRRMLSGNKFLNSGTKKDKR